MSAKFDRAGRMARAANRGNRVAAGFPIVDEVTLRLRVAEYRQAEKKVDQAIGELNRLAEHIVKRGFALAEKSGAGVLNALPEEWVVQELASREAESGKARVAERMAEIQAAGSPPYTHSMGGDDHA